MPLTTPDNPTRTRIALYDVQRVRVSCHEYWLSSIIRHPDNLCDYCVQVLRLHSYAQEHFALLSLNIKNRVVGVNIIAKGTVDSAIVHPRDVYQAAILNSAAAIVVAHNHPSGDVSPSIEDIQLTKRLAEAGKIIGIQLLDHLIIGEPSSAAPYHSMAEHSQF